MAGSTAHRQLMISPAGAEGSPGHMRRAPLGEMKGWSICCT